MKNIILGICFISLSLTAQDYKDLINDTSINFYDVCDVAERYFDTIDKYAKGSGYKGFLRWKEVNEYKYFPTGRRDNVDPHFAQIALEKYKTHFPEQFIESVRMSGNGWRELGPNSISEISGHYAAGIGRIEEVYAAPGNKNKLYLGSRSGGLWRSLDEGLTWQGGASDFLPGSGVNTFAVDPFNTDHLLVNVRNSRNGTTYGIYQSTDGGATLTETAFNPTNLGEGGLGSNFAIHVVAYHPTIANMVFVGTNRGLYKSTDNLITWTEVNTSGSYPFIKFHPTNPMIIYTVNHNSGDRDYVYKSSNTGDAFAKTSQIIGNANRSARIEVSANAPSNVYFANSNGIHKSTDSGASFTLIAVPSATGGVGAFGVNDMDETNMITGGIDAWRSDDEGVSFSQVTYWSLGNSNHGSGNFQSNYENSTVYVHADLRKINSVNGVFYMGTDGTMVKSEDGGTTWIDLMRTGVGVRENYKLGVSQSNNGITICGSQDNGTSIYKSTGWLEFYGADGMEGLVHPLNDDWMIGSIQNGGRRRTKDGGLTQDGVSPSGSSSGYWQAPIAYDPNNHMTIYDFRDGVRRSEDFGSSHTLLGAPSFSGTMQLAELAQNNSDIMIVTRNSSIEKSVNGGVTFSNIKGTLPNHAIQDVAFDPMNDDRIIVVNASYQNNGQKVYLSEDGGSTWSNITFNIGDIPVHSVVIDHTVSANIYLGTEVGVYTKPLSSNVWSLYSTDLPNTTVEELEINFGANTIKGATWGRGLWEFDLVNRKAFPSIVYTKISDVPTAEFPKENVEQFVTSEIIYTGTLTNVYVRWSLGIPDFSNPANSINMSNTVGNTWVTDTEIPNQPEGTKVYFKVFAEGASSDLSETYKFMYTVKPFELCVPTVQNGTSDYINLFEVANTTTTIYTNTSGNDGYTSYTNSPIPMVIGEDYTFDVRLAGAFSGDEAGVWIDFNQNAQFDDDESVTMSDYVNNIASGTIQIPVHAETGGIVTMRIRNSFFNTVDPCNFDAGEVEDYRVQIIDPCTTTTTFTGTWDSGAPTNGVRAVVNSSLTLSGTNLEACSLVIGTDAIVTINSGQYARIQGNIVVNGTLIVEHEGSVVQVFDSGNTSLGISGHIEVRKTTPVLEPLGFMFLSSPVSNETRDGVYGTVNGTDMAFRIIEVVSPNFIVDPLLEAHPPYAGAEIFLGSSNSFLNNYVGSEILMPGDGLVVYPQPSITDGDINYNLIYQKGTLNSGNISYPVQYNGLTKNNFNLIGNPYPSAIDATVLINENDMINEIYFWEHLTAPDNSIPGYNGNNYSMNDISIRNLAGGSAATNGGTIPNQFIASGQGFAIKAVEGAAENVLFTNAMRVTTNNDQYRSSEDENRLWLSLSNDSNDLKSSSLVAFLPQATTDLDAGFDSKRVASTVSLFTTTKNNEYLGIQSLGVFDKKMEIPLGYATELEEVTYTISLENVQGDALSEIPVYLVDKYAQTYVNLKERPYYFTSSITVDTNRFVIVFEEKEVLGISNSKALEAAIRLAPNPAQDHVVLEYAGSELLESLSVFSIQGQLIMIKTLFDFKQSESIDISTLSSGVYFVRVASKDTQVTKKLIIN
jgi:hypothetical protein